MLPTDRFKPDRERVAAEVVDGEAILIDLTTGVYYSMDGVAAIIWSLIERQQSGEEIVAALSGIYDVQPSEIAADVAALMDTLLTEGLIISADEALAASDRLIETAQQPYATPKLDIYRDMSVLLALDPPMPGLQATPWQAPKSMA